MDLIFIELEDGKSWFFGNFVSGFRDNCVNIEIIPIMDHTCTVDGRNPWDGAKTL